MSSSIDNVPDEVLTRIAFNIIVRAVKDIHNPSSIPGYNRAEEIENILQWIETDHFKAVCVVADLSPAFVSRLIERVCGLQSDMKIVLDLSELVPRRLMPSGVDIDPEELIWGD